MAKQIQLRRGTTAENNAFTGANGELTYDTEKKQLRVHDGSTVGGKVVDDPTRDVTSQVSNATETLAGKAKVATTAIAQAGVNDTDFLTPLKLRNALNANGSAPVYACRAWVNFNGVGVVSVIASGNVSSVTDNGVGDYTLNFATPMPNANYSISASSTEYSDGAPIVLSLRMSGTTPLLKTTSAVRVSARSAYSSALLDVNNISVQVFC